jgi:hypothetical protein
MVAVKEFLDYGEDVLCLNPDTSFLHKTVFLALPLKRSAIGGGLTG